MVSDSTVSRKKRHKKNWKNYFFMCSRYFQGLSIQMVIFRIFVIPWTLVKCVKRKIKQGKEKSENSETKRRLTKLEKISRHFREHLSFCLKSIQVWNISWKIKVHGTDNIPLFKTHTHTHTKREREREN